MNHEQYMQMALELALKGTGHVSPHPLAGAVFVREGKILSVGHYPKYGSSSAEKLAILNAKNQGVDLTGSTLYCNFLSTVKELAEEKISRVVIANTSDSESLQFLHSQQIEVLTGVMEQNARALNEVYFTFQETKKPFLHFHDQQEIDHRLRQKYDCLLVDGSFIEKYDPSLLNESTDFEILSQPLRVVVCPLSQINPDWKILTDDYKRNTMIISTHEDVRNHPEMVRLLESRAVALLSANSNGEGKVDFESLLNSLAGLKLTSVLIEGDGKRYLNIV